MFKKVGVAVGHKVESLFEKLERMEERVKASDAKAARLEQAIAGLEMEKNKLAVEMVAQMKAAEETINKQSARITELERHNAHIKRVLASEQNEKSELFEAKARVEEGLHAVREQNNSLQHELDTCNDEKERLRERVVVCETQALEIEAALRKKHKHRFFCFI